MQRMRRLATIECPGVCLVAWLGACVGMSACAPGARVEVSETRTVFAGADQGRGVHPRCRGYDVAAVPARYAALEAEIAAWIATCVTSRTDGAHRELALVVGNASLRALWRASAAGQRLRVVPRYEWSGDPAAGTGRVERIVFWSPDIPGTGPPDDGGGGDASGTAPADAGRAPEPGGRAGPADPGGPGDPAGPRDIRVIRDPPGLPGLPGPPDDLRGIVDDAGRMLDWLRRAGAGDDARRLAALLERARPIVTDVVLLVGGYYLASRLLAGRLVFQWGWRAAGPVFARRLARLDRLLPGAERTLGELSGEMARVASTHPQLGGAGIDWEVINQLWDPGVPAQLDANACGPACLQMVLQDRGIFVSQEKLIDTARNYIPQLKTERVSSGTLAGILKELDPGGGWTRATRALIDSNDNVRALGQLFSQHGSWIAPVDQHFVVVDGLDSAGNVLIRDPWPESGKTSGFSGSRYRVSLRTFRDHWIADYTVYRK